MSKRKPHNVKVKFKRIDYEKKSTKEAATAIIIYLNGKRVLIVLCFHLNFFSNKGCPKRLIHMVLTNGTFLFKSAQQCIGSHFFIIISYT